MNDVRTLLDDATARDPHPDPVGAVRAAVRRRARRRATLVASAAAVAVLGTVVVATRPAARRPDVTTTPTATATATAPASPSPTPPGTYGTAWRRPPADPGGAVAERVARHVAAHPGELVWLAVTPGPDGEVQFEIGYGNGLGLDRYAEVERRLWLELPDVPWRLVPCPYALADYDRAAAEIPGATWPSGARPKRAPALWGRRDSPCVVTVLMPYRGPNAEDVAYAAERWGGAVRVMHDEPDADGFDPHLTEVLWRMRRHPDAFIGPVVVDGVVYFAYSQGYGWERWQHVWAPYMANHQRWENPQCRDTTAAELRAVQAELRGYTTRIAPWACAVDVRDDLTAARRDELRARFGDAVVFGSEPLERL